MSSASESSVASAPNHPSDQILGRAPGTYECEARAAFESLPVRHRFDALVYFPPTFLRTGERRTRLDSMATQHVADLSSDQLRAWSIQRFTESDDRDQVEALVTNPEVRALFGNEAPCKARRYLERLVQREDRIRSEWNEAHAKRGGVDARHLGRLRRELAELEAEGYRVKQPVAMDFYPIHVSVNEGQYLLSLSSDYPFRSPHARLACGTPLIGHPEDWSSAMTMAKLLIEYESRSGGRGWRRDRDSVGSVVGGGRVGEAIEID